MNNNWGVWNILREGDFDKTIQELEKLNVPYEIVFEPLTEEKLPDYKLVVVPDGIPEKVLVTTKELEVREFSDLDRAIDRIKARCPSLTSFRVLTKPRVSNEGQSFKTTSSKV